MGVPLRSENARLEAGRPIGGKYRLLSRLGTGGMGEVWRAQNETTGAHVAIKVMGPSGDEARGARFRNEARLGSMLSHRSIVRIFDLVEDEDGTLALVMELLRGESVAEWLQRKGTVSTKEAVAVALPVLSALAHAHASGVVHRDLTPANVFLAVDPDGTVVPKLVDFGIAKAPAAVSTLTLEGSVLGTPRYMAPEHIRGAADIDGRSDLFSLATSLYEMIVGASPFAAPTPAASLAAVLESPVDPDPRIEPRVWIELQRALSKRPYERHHDADELARALRAAIGDTDASLALLLKRDPPAPDRLDEPAPSFSSSSPSFSGHLLDVPVGASRARSQQGQHAKSHQARAGWIVGGALAVCAILLAAAVARQTSPEPAATAAPTPAPAPSPVDVARPPPLSTDVIPIASSASTASKAGTRPVPSVPPRHAAPVATTPGF
jgi:serine/threonine protein kinase